MTAFVVDASVAIKWVLDEDHSDAALRLQGHDTLIVPDFFFAEISNVLWKRTQRGEVSLEDAVADYRAVSDYPWTIFASQQLAPIAMEIAIHTGQAVYDALYLALALEKNCPMVTADQKFVRSISSEALQGYVMWVEDIPRCSKSGREDSFSS